MMYTHCRQNGSPGRLGLLLSAILLASGGCGGDSNNNQANTRVATEVGVRAEVQGLAVQIADTAGKGKLVRPVVHSSECDSDAGDTSGEVRYIQGVYNIELPAAKHYVAFTSVREHWRKMGWEITQDRFRQDLNEGVLSAQEQRNGADFTLSSTTSADGLAIVIHSGCFREAQHTAPPSRIDAGHGWSQPMGARQ